MKPTMSRSSSYALPAAQPACQIAVLPDWFDAAAHQLGPYGVCELVTGHLLAVDGWPASGPVRAQALAAAGLAGDALGLVSNDDIAVYKPSAASAAVVTSHNER
jgi:hypothetical protein